MARGESELFRRPGWRVVLAVWKACGIKSSGTRRPVPVGNSMENEAAPEPAPPHGGGGRVSPTGRSDPHVGQEGEVLAIGSERGRVDLGTDDALTLAGLGENIPLGADDQAEPVVAELVKLKRPQYDLAWIFDVPTSRTSCPPEISWYTVLLGSSASRDWST